MRKILFFLVLTLLHSCALQSYLVPQVDLLIELRIQGQLDLYYRQKKELAKDIDNFLNSQKPRIPEIIALAESLEFKATGQNEKVFDSFINFYQIVASDFNHLLCRYLALLDANQIKQFFQKQTEDNNKIIEQISEQNIDKLKERVEFFTGSVSSEQLPILRSFLPAWKLRTEQRLKRREALQTELRSILSKDLSAKEKSQELKKEFDAYNFESFKDKEVLLRFMNDLKATLNSQQVKHLQEKQRMLIELLKTFSEVTF